jgi:hypothetical protein
VTVLRSFLTLLLGASLGIALSVNAADTNTRGRIIGGASHPLPDWFKESLRYLAGGYYQQTDYHSYSRQRTEELLEACVTIDLGQPRQ